MANIKAAVHVCIYMFRFSSSMKRRKTHPLGPWMSKHTDDFADLFAMWCGRSPWFTFGHCEFEMFLHQKRPNLFCASSGTTKEQARFDVTLEISYLPQVLCEPKCLTTLACLFAREWQWTSQTKQPTHRLSYWNAESELFFINFPPVRILLSWLLCIYTHFLFLCVVVFCGSCFFLLKVFRCYIFCFFIYLDRVSWFVGSWFLWFGWFVVMSIVFLNFTFCGFAIRAVDQSMLPIKWKHNIK